MADSTTAYRIIGNDHAPWDTTGSVVVARADDGSVTKELVVGGDPVYLTDEERGRIPGWFHVRKATDHQVEQADDTSGAPDAPEVEQAEGGAVLPTNTSRGVGARAR